MASPVNVMSANEEILAEPQHIKAILPASEAPKTRKLIKQREGEEVHNGEKGGRYVIREDKNGNEKRVYLSREQPREKKEEQEYVNEKSGARFVMRKAADGTDRKVYLPKRTADGKRKKPNAKADEQVRMGKKGSLYVMRKERKVYVNEETVDMSKVLKDWGVA